MDSRCSADIRRPRRPRTTRCSPTAALPRLAFSSSCCLLLVTSSASFRVDNSAATVSSCASPTTVIRDLILLSELPDRVFFALFFCPCSGFDSSLVSVISSSSPFSSSSRSLPVTSLTLAAPVVVCMLRPVGRRTTELRALPSSRSKETWTISLPPLFFLGVTRGISIVLFSAIPAPARNMSVRS